MTGVLQFAVGSASAPSAKIGSDQKGFYHEGTDKLGVSVAGVKVGEFNSNGYLGKVNRLVVQDRKASGTDGGASIVGLNDRDLTDIILSDIAGVSLSANQITLPIGRFYIKKISCPSRNTSYNKIRLYNVTDNIVQQDINSNDIIGTSMYNASIDVVVNSEISGYYFDVLITPKSFKITHECGSAFASGLGTSTAFGDEEIYTTIEIEKVG